MSTGAEDHWHGKISWKELWITCFFLSPEAGSRFWQGGSFEVRKSVEGEQGETEGEAGTTRISSLEVTVPSELEGVAYIQVEVKTVPGESAGGRMQRDLSFFFLLILPTHHQ